MRQCQAFLGGKLFGFSQRAPGGDSGDGHLGDVGLQGGTRGQGGCGAAVRVAGLPNGGRPGHNRQACQMLSQ